MNHQLGATSNSPAGPTAAVNEDAQRRRSDLIARDAAAALRCGRCGEPTDATQHPACVAALELEPPRYCAQCRRRMIVQVTPHGWAATCSVHDTVTS